MIKKINDISSIPQIRIAFAGWKKLITIIKITIEIIDYEAVQTRETIRFAGVIQPLKNEEILIKPIEQRSFRWLQIHCFPDVELIIGDLIEYSNKYWKVMTKKDYSLNNYIEYHLIEQLDT